MKTKFASIITIILFAITLTSCSNDDPIALPVPTPTPNGFRWTENGGSTVQTASIVSFTEQYNTLYAKNDPIATIFEINLTSGAAGTYTLGGSNALAYVVNSAVFQATAGSVIVTANANGKISGTFTATGPDAGGVTSVSGTFKNIEIVP